MADERSCPRTRDVDRHDEELRDIRRTLREEYLLKELFLSVVTSLTERVKDLEEEATSHRRGHEEESKSIRRGNRVAILAGIGTVVAGVVLQFVQKGGAH